MNMQQEGGGHVPGLFMARLNRRRRRDDDDGTIDEAMKKLRFTAGSKYLRAARLRLDAELEEMGRENRFPDCPWKIDIRRAEDPLSVRVTMLTSPVHFVFMVVVPGDPGEGHGASHIYPFQPPTVHLLAPVLSNQHPCIHADSTVLLRVLQRGNWSCAMGITEVIRDLIQFIPILAHCVGPVS